MRPRGHSDCVEARIPLLRYGASWKQGGHCEAAGEPAETIVTLQGLVTLKGHCGTAGPRGTNETIVTSQGLMGARGHCDTARPHRTEGPL